MLPPQLWLPWTPVWLCPGCGQRLGGSTAFRLRRRSAHPRDAMGLHRCGAHMPPGAPQLSCPVCLQSHPSHVQQWEGFIILNYYCFEINGPAWSVERRGKATRPRRPGHPSPPPVRGSWDHQDDQQTGQNCSETFFKGKKYVYLESYLKITYLERKLVIGIFLLR